MSAHQVLEHLAPKSLQDLVVRYYAGERISVLMKEFHITCPPSELYLHLPPEPTEHDCSLCGTPLLINRRSRTSIRWKKASPAYCPKCGHEASSDCRCLACKISQKHKKEETQKLEQLAILNFCTELWSYEPIDVAFQQLSAEEAIALLSLVRCGEWIDENSIGSLHDKDIPFAPMKADFKNSLLNTLLASGLIAPIPDSPSSAFVIKHGKVVSWKPDEAKWHLLFPAPPKFIQQLESLVDSRNWPDGWLTACFHLWRQLAAAECWEFCAYSVAQRSLPMPGNTALTSLIDNLLRNYSVAQCYQLIWSSASDATDYKARKRITTQHAANYLIGACQRRADRSRAEGWTIKGFRRNFQLPRSQVSHVLHDVFLKHGITGFITPPRIDRI